MTTLIESEVSLVIDGKIFDMGLLELPASQHMEVRLEFVEKGKCTCPPKEPTKSEIVGTEEDLDALPVYSIIADKDHDDWEKAGSGDWVHKQGPHLRAKTLVALWGPFTVVRVGNGR